MPLVSIENLTVIFLSIAEFYSATVVTLKPDGVDLWGLLLAKPRHCRNLAVENRPWGAVLRLYDPNSGKLCWKTKIL